MIASDLTNSKSPLNRYDGMYLPQEYRALTLLDNNLVSNIFVFIGNYTILDKLVTTLYFIIPEESWR